MHKQTEHESWAVERDRIIAKQQREYRIHCAKEDLIGKPWHVKALGHLLIWLGR